MNQLASKLANSVRQAKTENTKNDAATVSPEVGAVKASTSKASPAKVAKAPKTKVAVRSVEDDAALPVLSFNRRVWPD